MRRLIGLAALVFVGVLAWRVGDMLSTDAIGMAVGMTLGVLAGVPTAALVLLARRRDDEDKDDDDDYIDVQPTQPTQPTIYADQVTPYTHLMRSAMRMPALPKRSDVEPATLTPAQIAEVEAYLAHQKTLSGVRQVDPRQFVVRWNGQEKP